MTDTIHIQAGAMPGDMLLSSTPSCSRALEDLYFAFSASDAGGVSRLTGGLVRVPDTLLVQRLAELRRLQRRHGFRLDLDSSSEALIRAFLAESGELSAARGDSGLALTSTEVSLALKTNGFRRELTREQIRDVGRLAALGNGANFSVPGAGKTTALLAVHELVRQQEAPDMKLLVVAPRNAFISWDEEIAECLGWDATMVRLTGGRQRIAAALRLDPPIVGITYQQLPSVLADVEAYARRNRVHVVLDESHRAKGGRAAVQGAAVLALAPLAARRDILSGTPMPQGLADLVPQFDFLWPGHSVCVDLAAGGDDPMAQVRAANVALSPLFVRTKKSELGLPPPVRRLVRVRLGEQQRELYELLRSEAARLASGLDRTDRSKLRALGRHVVRLIQTASNPQLLLAGLERGSGSLAGDSELIFLLRSTLRDEPPAKLTELHSLITGILSTADAKVVIWSSFVANIDYLVQVYADQGAVGIHGGIPTGDDEDLAYREARIRKFNQDPACRVMVANPAACGEGISLHRACHNAVYLDRSYNAAHYLQSVDRIHRLGVPEGIDTNVYMLMAEDTIDDSLEARVTKKIAAMGAVLDDDQLQALAYDPEDAVDELPAGISDEDVDSILAHLSGGESSAE